MSCSGGHHSCDCRYDLLVDAIDSLSEILSGLNEYRNTLSMVERTALSKKVHGITHALSVIQRGRKI